MLLLTPWNQQMTILFLSIWETSFETDVKLKRTENVLTSNFQKKKKKTLQNGAWDVIKL